MFEVDKDADHFVDDSDEAAFERAFGKKNYVNAIICTSDSNKRSTLFTLVKEKDESTGFITKMRLLKKMKNRKDLEIDSEAEADYDPTLHSFYITDAEYQENQDSYAQISNKMIKIYDK